MIGEPVPFVGVPYQALMGLEMPTTRSFTNQLPPPVLARPNSSLKTFLTQLKLVSL